MAVRLFDPYAVASAPSSLCDQQGPEFATRYPFPLLFRRLAAVRR